MFADRLTRYSYAWLADDCGLRVDQVEQIVHWFRELQLCYRDDPDDTVATIAKVVGVPIHAARYICAAVVVP